MDLLVTNQTRNASRGTSYRSFERACAGDPAYGQEAEGVGGRDVTYSPPAPNPNFQKIRTEFRQYRNKWQISMWLNRLVIWAVAACDNKIRRRIYETRT